MSGGNQLSLFERWRHQPQKTRLRRAIFQVHLWCGIVLGLYIFMISITGSVLVYRNELYRAATQPPIVLKGSGPQLSNEQLSAAALRLYPGYRVERILHSSKINSAVDIWLRRGNDEKERLFNPWTGSDLGDSVPIGIRLVSGLLDLHDNLFAGPTGRQVNGLGAILLILIAGTGLVIWWPGVKTWRRSLAMRSGVGWKRGIWHLHSMVGFWSLAFTVVFGASGIYLAFPEKIQEFADWLDPVTPANARDRIADQVIYWLAYLHFGRIQGIGIPCKGPGFCDQATKAVWAAFGLAPAVLFATGAIMWWSRILGPKMARARREAHSEPRQPAENSIRGSGDMSEAARDDRPVPEIKIGLKPKQYL